MASYLSSDVVGSRRYRHSASGQAVSLYVYQGALERNCSYRQMFEIATCTSRSTSLHMEGKTFACKESQTNMLATILITSSQWATGQFQNCHPVSAHSSARHLCRDWIRVTTHCKLYYRDNNPSDANEFVK